MADRIQFRRDTVENWEEYNPILADGEIGIERDSQRFKLGDGIKVWTELPYSSNRLTDDYFAYIDKEDVVNMAYGSEGELTETTLANGCKKLYSYTDSLLTEIDYTDTDGATVVAKETFNYDDANQLTSVTKTVL